MASPAVKAISEFLANEILSEEGIQRHPITGFPPSREFRMGELRFCQTDLKLADSRGIVEQS
jgi:hypothetical protein